MQPEDPARKADALKKDDASIKTEGENLPQGRDVLSGARLRCSV